MSPLLDRKANRRQSSVMRLETLEARTMLSGSTVDVTTSADNGPGSLRQAILDADALGGQSPVSIVFELATTDPGYNPTTNSWSIQVNSTLPTLTATGVLVDTSGSTVNVPGGIVLQGTSTSSDILTVIGNAQETATDLPDPAATGSGTLSLGGLSIVYSGLVGLSAANFSSLTLRTPNPGNVLGLTSPSPAFNQVAGSSGGTSILPLAFTEVSSFTIDDATNDGSSTTLGDSINISPSGLVASGLANFAILTGPANSSLTDLASSFALPVSGGTFTDIGGSGDNTVIGQADVNYSVSSNSLSIPGAGSITLSGVQALQLTGGVDSTSFSINGWTGDLTLDGGPGSNQLSILEPGNYGGNLSLNDFASTSIQIQGNFSGTISAPQTETIQQILILGSDLAGSSITSGAYMAPSGSTSPSVRVVGDFGGTITALENLSIPGSGVLDSIEIDGNLLTTGQLWTGDIGTLTIGNNLNGEVTAQGAGTIGTIKIGGNLNGIVSAPEDPNPGSGKIGKVTIGGSLTGTISSGNISGIVVGADLLGVIIAEGAGTIGTINIGGNLAGLVYAPEDIHAGSGQITGVSIGGSLTGTISSGNISGIVVGADLLGVIIAEGAGTIGTITVGGNLGGTVTAPEDPNPGSGKIGTITVGGSLTGTISSGNISGIVVGADLLGVIIAEGAGTIGSVAVGGSLSGSVTALQDNNAGSGTINSISVNGTVSGKISASQQLGTGTFNSIGQTGSVLAGNLGSSLSINSLSGSFSYQTSGQSGSITIGNVTSSGVLSGTSTQGTLTIGTLVGKLNLGTAGSVTYLSMAQGSEIDATSIASLTIFNDLAGVVNVSGDLGQLIVSSGSLAASGLVMAGSLESATIGQNLAGSIQVKGTLGNLSVGGSTPGSIIAGQVGTISAQAATGPVILQIQENGVERQLQADNVRNPFPQPGDAATGPLARTTFKYLYESAGFSSPQLTVKVTNRSGATRPNQFDLGLVVYGSAKFNLARLDASGVSGIANVAVEGDILTAVSSTASAFFAGDSTKAGVQLPLDQLAGVEVRDFIPYGGYIQSASIQAISAGKIGLAWGSTSQGASASAYSVQSLLGSGTRIVQASDTFRVPFSGNSGNQVGFFIDDNTYGQFDWANVAFTIQNDVTATSSTLSNVARGADVALITVNPVKNSNYSLIQGINIMGDGASFSTYLWVNGPIVSSGSLGDLSLLNWQPVGDISASTIFGTILSYAPFNGTIQTTGLSTNPITGAVTASSGDFGRAYLNSGNQLVTTNFTTYSGAFSGQLIVRGNLVSSVVLNGGFSGLIAAQGNIGISPGLGGITDNGNDSGTIFAMGAINGNLTVNGMLTRTGTIAAGLGIFGFTKINGGMADGSRIVSGGAIGSTGLGTSLTVYGNTRGIITSVGNLYQWSGDVGSPTTLANLQGTPSLAPSLAAVEAVFAGAAGGVTALTSFDSTPGSLDLDSLEAILEMLAELHISKGQLSN